MKSMISTMVLISLTSYVSAQSVRSGDALLKELRAGTTFKIKDKNEQCPEMIDLEKSDKYLPEYTKPGDITIRINGYQKIDDNLSWDNFTHENNSVTFRPSLAPGKKHKLHGDCEIILGIACNSGHQLETQDSIKFDYWARIGTFVMIAKVDSSIEYNSKSRELSYIFKANGIDDVVCRYNPDPTLKTIVDAFKQRTERENRGIVDADRKSGKDVNLEEKADGKKVKGSKQ